MFRMLFFLIPLIIMACADDSETEIRVLSASGDLERGSEVTIRYNSLDKDARLSVDDTLYLTISLRTTNGYTKSRSLPSRIEDGSAFFRYNVPDNAVFATFSVGLREVYIGNTTMSGIVHEQGNPVRSSIPQMIMQADSYQEALEYYRADSLLYPDCYDRAMYMFIAMASSGMADNIQPAVLAAIEKDAHEALRKQARSQASAGFAVSCLGHHLRKDHKNLLRVLAEMNKEKLGLDSPEAMEPIQTIMGTIFQPDGKGLFGKETDCEIAKRVLYLATCTKVNRLRALDMFRRVAIVSQYDCIGRMFAVAVDSAYTPLRSLSGPEMFDYIHLLKDISHELIRRKEFNKAIDLYESKKSWIMKSTQWYSENDGGRVAIFQMFGIEVQLTWSYALAMLGVGDTTSAMAVLTELVERPQRSEYTYQQCMALKQLAKIAVATRDTALAGTVVTRTAEINCRDRRKVFGVLEKLIDPDQILANMESKLINNIPYNIPEYTFETNRGKFHLSRKSDRLTLLYFTGEHCSICRIEMGGILEAALSSEMDIDMIHIHDGAMHEIDMKKTESNPRYYRVSFDRDITSTFRVKGYPELLLVKGGKLLLQGITKGSILEKELEFLENYSQL